MKSHRIRGYGPPCSIPRRRKYRRVQVSPCSNNKSSCGCEFASVGLNRQTECVCGVPPPLTIHHGSLFLSPCDITVSLLLLLFSIPIRSFGFFSSRSFSDLADPLSTFQRSHLFGGFEESPSLRQISKALSGGMTSDQEVRRWHRCTRAVTCMRRTLYLYDTHTRRH